MDSLTAGNNSELWYGNKSLMHAGLRQKKQKTNQPPSKPCRVILTTKTETPRKKREKNTCWIGHFSGHDLEEWLLLVAEGPDGPDNVHAHKGEGDDGSPDDEGVENSLLEALLCGGGVV